MDRQPPHNSESHPSPRRVALVGRNLSLEAELRKLEGIELLRARTATDALGELSLAHEEGYEIEALLIAESALEPEERASFEAAVHSLAPEARLLHLDGLNSGDMLAELRNDPPFDDPSDFHADEREGNTGIASSSEPDDVSTSQSDESNAGGTDVSPVRPAAAAVVPAAPVAPDHCAIVDAILSGADPSAIVIESIRQALADPSIRFIPGSSGVTAPSAPVVADVQRRGVHAGWLIAQHAARDALAARASELASWLAIAQQQRQLHTAAFTDQLTSAWNRRYFDYFFPRAIDDARQQRRDVTLMVYDIDDFKSYNDRFGHAAGDEILRETVRLLLSVIRPSDRVCRMGGDEFAVIFTDPQGPRVGAGHHPNSIAEIAKRFQRQICDHRFPKLAMEAPGTLTISGGLATFPWDGITPEELLSMADHLALQSKRLGKNVITFGPGAQRACHAEPESSPAEPPAGAETDADGTSS